ncbi:hypothetical protein MTO96_004659 [Rhipicephalus appendiculatus]
MVLARQLRKQEGGPHILLAVCFLSSSSRERQLDRRGSAGGGVRIYILGSWGVASVTADYRKERRNPANNVSALLASSRNAEKPSAATQHRRFFEEASLAKRQQIGGRKARVQLLQQKAKSSRHDSVSCHSPAPASEFEALGGGPAHQETSPRPKVAHVERYCRGGHFTENSGARR